MRRFGWRWFVLNSILLTSLAATAETRPQYGGVLRIQMRAAATSLDPTQTTQPESFAQRSLTMLLFDTLVNLDDNGNAQASLATSWQAVSGSQRWQLHLRRGVMLDDGTPLTPEIAAASLRFANPAWNVTVEGDSIVIEWDKSNPDLLAELALPRNAVVKRSGDKPNGTGPFHLVDFQPGKKVTLAANDTCWRGRPFLDGIEIDMGKSFRDQMTSLEIGKADLIEVAPEQVHRVSQEGRQLASSPAMEVLALVFERDPASADEKSLRQALAGSVERGSIRNVLLQGEGQPAASILPNWMSGYGFVFPTAADLTRARQAREQVRNVPAWKLGYDAGDPLARLLAERIALNARDAGLFLQPTTLSATDLRLARIPLASADPWIALASVAASNGLPPFKHGDNVEDLYASEVSLLSTLRIIPLFDLPASYASVVNLRDWRVQNNGTWNVADAWLATNRP